MQGCRRIPWFAVLLVAGCGMLGGLPKLPTDSPMGAAQSALNRLTGGTLDAEGARLIREVGPTAEHAIAEIARAVLEVRVGHSIVEDASRLVAAATQSFYTDECTTAAAFTGTGASPAIPSDVVGFEREAGEAFASANYGKASSLLQSVYETQEKLLGAAHPVVLHLLNKRASVQLAVNNYKQATALVLPALQSREQSLRRIKATFPPSREEVAGALAVAESATTLAGIYSASSVYAGAKQNYERAIELRSHYLGADHECAAQSQNGLGELLQLMGDYPAARRLFESALRTRQTKLGPRHRDTARTLNDLASLYRSIGDLSHAQDLYRRALDVRLTFGVDDVDVAESHNDLGDLYKLRGEYASAESEYRQAFEIRRRKLGEGVETAQSQSALAGLYQTMGDYRRAQDLYSVVCEIRRKFFGPDHPETAESLSALGDSHRALGDHTKAESEYNQALEVRRNKLGRDHPLVASSLVVLGNMHLDLGDYDRAESEYNQAREIQQNKLGSEHPDVAQSQHQLGLLHEARGDYAKAESLLRSALSLRETKLGAGHPSVAESLVTLAKLMMVTGRQPQALEYAQRAFGISERLLQSIGAVASESRVDALLRLLRAQEEIAYSLLLERSFPAEAATFAMSVALLRKGRSLDEAAGASRAAYQSLEGSSGEQLAELRATRAKLGELTMAGSSDTAELQRLADHADEVEQALAKQSAPLRARRLLARPSEIVARVAQALPPDGVLVEVIAFRPSAVRAPRRDTSPSPQRYLALVLHRDASVRVVPLGPAAPIDQLVGDFRAQLTVDPKKVDNIHQVLMASEALYHRVFEPLRTQFAKVDKSIFLSLDSQLHLVPFAALFDGNQYLVETYQFTYLTSGRDLLRGEVAPRNSTTVEMIADPEFIKGRASGPAPRSRSERRGVNTVPDGAQPGARDAAPNRPFRLTSLRPLPGTVEEAQDLRHLLPATRVLLGTHATKQAFLGLRSPGILHVATHGLFRRGTGDAVPGSRTEIEGDRAALLNSMLMLAGAGVTSKGEVVVQPDGVATALEVASMNLWGTQLVVLSACETGVGDVSNLGQGVYGLRRAVMIAGAATLVTSLWKVDDQATRDLMRRYYETLLAGQGRVEAMRETADWMRRWRKHPYYWASFIVVGSREPLVGIGIDKSAKPGPTGPR